MTRTRTGVWISNPAASQSPRICSQGTRRAARILVILSADRQPAFGKQQMAAEINNATCLVDTALFRDRFEQ